MRCDIEYNTIRERLLRQHLQKGMYVKTLTEITHRLRDDVIALTGDSLTMIRWSVTPTTLSSVIELEVITQGSVYPFHFGETDMADPSIGVSAVMTTLRKVFT